MIEGTTLLRLREHTLDAAERAQASSNKSVFKGARPLILSLDA